MSKSERNKGAAGERELCRILFQEIGFEAKRNLSQTREGGCDIVCGPYDLEVKRRARIGQIYDWIEQVRRASPDPKRRRAVVCRADGKEWLAVLPLCEFLDILREAIEPEAKPS